MQSTQRAISLPDLCFSSLVGVWLGILEALEEREFLTDPN